MKFSDLLKEAVYDILGYMLPGLITIPFVILLINCNLNYSSIYSLYVDLTNLKLLLKSLNFPLSYYIPLLVASYMIGIFLKYLSIYVSKLSNSKLQNISLLKWIKSLFKKLVNYLKSKIILKIIPFL